MSLKFICESRQVSQYFWQYSVSWSCNVALWDISLYLVEWRICAIIRLYDQYVLDSSRLIRSHWFGSPVIRPWYYLQRRINAGAKFHPLPPPRDSHWDGGGELAQNPSMQTDVWMKLLRWKKKKNHWQQRRAAVVCWQPSAECDITDLLASSSLHRYW